MESHNDFIIPYDSLSFEQRIGTGYFGEVFRGDFWGTDVAIKKILKGLNADDQVLGDLRKEAKILGSLRHPNVVLFMGIVEEPEVCIVTEFCHRGSLFDILHSHEMIMDFKTMMKIAVGIAKGMTYLHCLARKIIHRDLKSHNVLIGEDWTAKICDFGISHVRQRIAEAEENPKAGHYGVIGTPEWMAPEILQGEAYDESADVYSYGVVLTEILTRQMPYRDRYEINGYMDVVDAVLDDDAIPTIPHWCPAFLVDIIHACLDRDPLARPAFTSLMERFHAIQKSDPRTQWFGKYDIPRLKEMLSSTRTVDHLLGTQELGLVQGTTAAKSVSAEDNIYFVSRLTELLGFWNPPLQSAVCHTLTEYLANSFQSDKYMDIIIEAGGHLELQQALETYDQTDDEAELDLLEKSRVLLSTLKPKLDAIENQEQAEYQEQQRQSYEQPPQPHHYAPTPPPRQPSHESERKYSAATPPSGNHHNHYHHSDAHNNHHSSVPPPRPPPTLDLKTPAKPPPKRPDIRTKPMAPRAPPRNNIALAQRTPPRPPSSKYPPSSSYPPRGTGPPQPPAHGVRAQTWNNEEHRAPPTVTFDPNVETQNKIAHLQNKIRKLLHIQQQKVEQNAADEAIQIQYEIKKLRGQLAVLQNEQEGEAHGHQRRLTIQEEVVQLQNVVRRKTYAQGREIELNHAEQALQLQMDIDNVNQQLSVLQKQQADLPKHETSDEFEPLTMTEMTPQRLKSIENALTQGGLEALKRSQLLDNRIKNFNTWRRKKHRRERTRERSRLIDQNKKSSLSRVVLSIEDRPEYNKEIVRQAKEENVMIVTVKTVKAAIDFLENNYDYSQGSDEFRVMTCLARDSETFFKRKKGGAEVIKKLRKKGYKGPILVYAPASFKARTQLTKNGININKDNIFISDSSERTLDFVTFSDDIQ